MPNSLRELLFGGAARRPLVETLTPRKSFDDVILPEATLRQLRQALVQIEKHDVLFHEWGLAERHSTGLGLAFNFAGAPGTGKTICAEAIAHALGRPLLVVSYAELESMWAGNTSKNVAEVFRWAEEQDAVLFFDEADAIASRRFSGVSPGRGGYEREANAVVNVLLRELEAFPGVVIFATNLAANFDPAFERRIRTHIRFEMPGAAEREQIWRVQLHPRRTPLAEDVDFRALAERYPMSGGDIKNAVLKAAQAAIAEPGADVDKRIHQRHFEQAVAEVLAARSVMEQSVFADAEGELAALAAGGAGERIEEVREGLEAEIAVLAERLGEVERAQRTQVATLREMGSLERQREEERAAWQLQEQQLERALSELQTKISELVRGQQRRDRALGALIALALLLAAAALVVGVG